MFRELVNGRNHLQNGLRHESAKSRGNCLGNHILGSKNGTQQADRPWKIFPNHTFQLGNRPGVHRLNTLFVSTFLIKQTSKRISSKDSESI